MLMPVFTVHYQTAHCGDLLGTGPKTGWIQFDIGGA